MSEFVHVGQELVRREALTSAVAPLKAFAPLEHVDWVALVSAVVTAVTAVPRGTSMEVIVEAAVQSILRHAAEIFKG